MLEYYPNNSVELSISMYKSDDSYWVDFSGEGKQLWFVGGVDSLTGAISLGLLYLVDNGYVTLGGGE